MSDESCQPPAKACVKPTRNGPTGGAARRHTVRTADRKTVILHPYPKSLAIKAMCSECMGFETNPAECTSPMCPLFPYRGKTEKTLRGTATP